MVLLGYYCYKAESKTKELYENGHQNSAPKCPNSTILVPFIFLSAIHPHLEISRYSPLFHVLSFSSYFIGGVGGGLFPDCMLIRHCLLT